MAPALSKRTPKVLLIALLLCVQVACEPTAQVRVYEAPKSESTFVTGPLSGSDPRSSVSNASTSRNASGANPVTNSTPSAGPKRILGAIIPTQEGCYFLKATESPEKLEALLGDIRAMVESFAVDEQTGRPSSKLADGWVMNPRNDIAIAEFISPPSTGQIKFTVTALAMPPETQWTSYLLSNVNRWRGQLKLPELTADTLQDSLLEVSRGPNSIPAYIFDAVGTGSGAMSASNPSDKATATASEPTSSKRPTLEYDLPEGWSVGQGSQFRLATLNIQSSNGPGEVTVSMATDNPQANTMMWYQQVAKESDTSKLQPLVAKTIESAETFPVGDKQATLYEIRIDQQNTSPTLLVVSLPTETPQMHLFVKLIGENRLALDQKDKLIQFVQSLKIK